VPWPTSKAFQTKRQRTTRRDSVGCGGRNTFSGLFNPGSGSLALLLVGDCYLVSAAVPTDEQALQKCRSAH
jgi:hypothetical protein